MTYLELASDQIEADEGRRKLAYVDTVGKVTIGIGFNLTDVGLWDDEIDYIFKNRVNQAGVDASVIFNFSDAISDQRKAVLVNMAYNLGHERLSGFHTLIACIAKQDWNGAADAMLASRWATQVGVRATRLAKHMRDG